jgi:hypothetical protein
MKFFETLKIFQFFIKYMGKMVGAGAGAKIFYKLEPEQHKNGPAPQHSIKGRRKMQLQCPFWLLHSYTLSLHKEHR